jgi:hypothetical protein
VADAVTEIIRLLEHLPPAEWERTLCRELGGRSWYVASTTGLGTVRELVAAGIAPRTARWKVRGR